MSCGIQIFQSASQHSATTKTCSAMIEIIASICLLKTGFLGTMLSFDQLARKLGKGLTIFSSDRLASKVSSSSNTSVFSHHSTIRLKPPNHSSCGRLLTSRHMPVHYGRQRCLREIFIGIHRARFASILE